MIEEYFPITIKSKVGLLKLNVPDQGSEPEQFEATPPPIWNRAADAIPSPIPKAADRKRGPKPDSENHEKVASIIRAYGEAWTTDENLMEICDELDRQKIPAPKTWATRSDGHAHTWSRGRHHYQHLVIKAIKDRLRALEGS